MQDLLAILEAKINPKHLFVNEPMKNHTTFRIGGPVDILVIPESTEEFIFAVNTCQKEAVPYYIIGNGSNLLVNDEGYRGVVIKTAAHLKGTQVLNDCRIKAENGILLSSLAHMALEAGYSGLEFASGIPGTLGGAVVMNAGAYDGEMRDVFESARILTQKGDLRTIYREDMQFQYRSSFAQKEAWIVLDVVLQLQKEDYNAIRDKMNDFNNRRKEKQPLEMPSAGSTFKRPDGFYAGKLIMDCGLRGYSIGGAQVSEKHCGFIVNTGSATAQDVLELISYIQRKVKDRFGIILETEVKVLGQG